MAMRTTNQIVIAVKENQPATEEELRLAVVSLNSIEHFIRDDLQKLIESIREGKPETLLKMKAEFAWGTIERMFNANKKPVDEWLGPGNIPWNPEAQERLSWAKRVYKKATGEEL